MIVSGKELASKMKKNPLLVAFANKIETLPIVTPSMIDKMLPDYIRGAEIVKLFKSK